MGRHHILRGWKYALFVGTVLGTIALATYPIIIEPLLNVDKYKKIHENAQVYLNQDDRQGGMSDGKK